MAVQAKLVLVASQRWTNSSRNPRWVGVSDGRGALTLTLDRRRELRAHCCPWLRLIARNDGADGLGPAVIASRGGGRRTAGHKTNQQKNGAQSLHSMLLRLLVWQAQADDRQLFCPRGFNSVQVRTSSGWAECDRPGLPQGLGAGTPYGERGDAYDPPTAFCSVIQAVTD
jgi:hypothetical protein